MRNISGSVIFVTGGASGLGESTVRQMHELGAFVSIADIDVARMNNLHASLKERILCTQCDVTKED